MIQIKPLHLKQVLIDYKRILKWFVIENHQDPFYLVNYHLSNVLTDVKNGILLVFELCTNRYGLGLSNESLFIIIAQGAAKLGPVKVGDTKKIQNSTPGHT